ncbi:HTH-type transcriptional regulator [Pseudocitrobacter vendiensis]|uniref:HTH-type transcriptional regulator n=1 Tax=Pseudocitrobacter vendiensis TaxID=2488306 RepID=A0ABN8TAE4_9ENTR|nr:HTH-type transcriptional regulator [Pseudocitrobacter vendiensis]CAH6636379.1 HTH-type transcriptional regulator [Pseudocitrobacter vendiensis]
MEEKDPTFELLSSLEEIVFKDASSMINLTPKPSIFYEFEELRKGTGLQMVEFAKAMGVSVSLVQEWESRRVKPSVTELKLLRLIQADQQITNR